MKKLTAIVLLVIALFLIGLTISQRRDTEPKQTGGSKLDVAPPEYYTELKAIEKLNSELPLSSDGITITFDYSQGKYIVSGQPGIDTQSIFQDWHAIDPYSMIARDRFLVK